MARAFNVGMPTSYFYKFNTSKAVFNGKVYIGLVDTDPRQLSNRVPVYLQNEDGTEIEIPPEGQPLRTSPGGGLEYNGSPATFALDSNFSMVVESNLGAQEYWFKNYARANLGSITAPGGITLVGNGVIGVDTLQEAVAAAWLSDGDRVMVNERTAGNGGGGIWNVVQTSTVTPNTFNIVQSTADPVLSLVLQYFNTIDIDAWGLVADGVTSDKDAVTNLVSFLESGITVDCKGKEISLGDITDLDLDGIFLINQIDNLTFANKPRWKINNLMTGASGELKIGPVFKFTDCNELTLTCDAEGDTFDVNSPHGPAFYYVENDTTDTTGLYIDTYATNAVAACMIEQKTGSDKRLSIVRGSNGGNNITYAHRAFQSGDDAHLTIEAKNHARSYYPIGVSSQHVDINSTDNQRVNDVLIKCFVGESSNINVFLNQKGSISSEWPVLIEHENSNTSNVSAIKEVDITLNTDKQFGGPNAEFFAFRQKITGGGTAGTSLNTTDEIRLTLLGNQASSANPKMVFLSGIATNNKGTWHTNMTDDVIDTRGFTFKKSDAIKIKRRGDLSSFTKQLWMQQINRSGVNILLTVSALADYTTGLGFAQTYGIRALLDDLGGGTVLNLNKVYGWNDGAAPAVTVTFSNFNLVVSLASDPLYETANSEICITAQFISNI